MSFFRKSKKTKAAPRQQANDSDPVPSVSSPDYPGSSLFARFKDRLHLDKQPASGSAEANRRPGFFNNASDVRIDHGTFVDIGGNLIINTYMQVCLGPFK
jgi:hypothetical protein